MPRISRTPQQVNVFRQEILDAALHLIIEHGFSELSMRKIASRLGVTATTIYNYYASRDKLCFSFSSVSGVSNYSLNPLPKPIRQRTILMKNCAQRWANTCVSASVILIITRLCSSAATSPKFLDCIGTPLEKVAGREKEKSIQTFLFIAQGIAEYLKISDAKARYLTIKLWTELNGIVSLLNSRLLREIEKRKEPLIKRLIADICERYHHLIIEKSLINSSKKRRNG